MKSKIFSKAGLFTAIFILVAGVLMISPDAKALLFGSKNININEALAPVQSSTATQSVNNEPEAPIVFPAAPSVVFKDGNGTTIDVSKQKGKVLFINFWATWCPPCIQEMPSINKLKKQFDEKDILFLMVDVDDNYKRSSKFMANRKYNLDVYTAVSEIPREFLSGSIPTTVIIDKEGKVVGHHEGGADYMHPEIIQFLKQLISK